MPIFLVVPKGTIVLAAYTRFDLAIRHARGELGVEVIEIDAQDGQGFEVIKIDVQDSLSDAILDNLSEYDEDDITPVVVAPEIARPKKP